MARRTGSAGHSAIQTQLGPADARRLDDHVQHVGRANARPSASRSQPTAATGVLPVMEYRMAVTMRLIG